MKTKLLFLTLLCAAFGGSLFAQVPVPIVAGVVTADVGRNNNFKIIVSQTVSSVVLSSSTSIPGGQQVTLFFTENATGGFAVTFGGNISNPCTVSTVANATTNCGFQYDSTSNTWFGVSGSGSGSTGFTNGSIVDPVAYGAKFNVQWSLTATIPTNTVTPNITVPGANFTVFNLNQGIQGTCCGPPGALAHVTSQLALPFGTITAVVDSTHVTVSTNSNAAASGTNNNLVFWGTDDTAAMTLAVTAAFQTPLNCKTLWLPGGAAFITTNLGSNNVPCQNGITGFTRPGGAVRGMNRVTSLLLPTSTFNFGTQCNGLRSGCLFSPSGSGITMQDMGIYGMDYGNTAASGAVNIVSLDCDSFSLNVLIAGWGGNDTNVTGISEGCGAPIWNLVGDGAGSTCLRVENTNGIVTGGSFCGDVKNSSVVVTAGGIALFEDFVAGLHSVNTAVNVVVNGTVFWRGGAIQPSPVTGEVLLQVNSGGKAYLDQMSALATSANTGGLSCVSGSRCFVRDSQFSGNGTGFSAASNGTGIVFDELGNTFTGPNFLKPTIATSGNGTIALTTASENEGGVFTLTAGTTTGATPTVTLTFNGTFSGAQAVAPDCQLTLLDGTVDGITFTGTYTTPAVVKQTAGSTTAVTWTILNGGATALTSTSTYGGKYSCRPR